MFENRLHIIGRKNHGKTTLVVDLVRLLAARGLRVGTIKHTHHHHELDTPGKDSHQHRMAGAVAVGILSPDLNAVFWPPTVKRDLDACDERYTAFAPLFRECHLVLVEGDTQTQGRKIEVWRASVGSDPMSLADRQIAAVVSDDLCPVPRPRFPRNDLSRLVAWILSTYRLTK
jgi:molybdopterin-guanine dinucleotide biosynthesis protein B